MAERKPNGSSSHEVTHYLNVENAKIVAFFMVMGFVLYHGIIHVKYGKFVCSSFVEMIARVF